MSSCLRVGSGDGVDDEVRGLSLFAIGGGVAMFKEMIGWYHKLKHILNSEAMLFYRDEELSQGSCRAIISSYL
jgi:hypothetical protein